MRKNVVKILVADDEKLLCELYSQELNDEGYKVITTTYGAEVMQIIEKQRPDVVVLDIRLADTDGLDLLARIRDRHYGIPVILNSAYSLYKNDLRSIAADYYVVKSVDLTELKTRIQQVLARSEKYEMDIGSMIMEGDRRDQTQYFVSG